ncbi:MAG TPA: acyl-CoA thioesterase, partial [Candidatus Bipolaricaulota bacterium]
MSDPRALLAGFAGVIELPVAWGEMDAFGHVNNIYYFRYFESGRLDYFARIGYLDYVKHTGLGPILASTQCTFRKPLVYPDTVSVGTRVS